jgi:hypothetical protein
LIKLSVRSVSNAIHIPGKSVLYPSKTRSEPSEQLWVAVGRQEPIETSTSATLSCLYLPGLGLHDAWILYMASGEFYKSQCSARH